MLRHELLAVFLYPLGLVIVAVAASGRAWCSFYLSGRKDSVLTIDGPYSLCRNPLYFFSGLGAIGVGLCTEILVYPVLILAIFAIYYPGIIRREEVRLGEIFGEAYIQYRLRTPAFFPSFKSFIEPQRWNANPRLFRRHLTDATMFVFIAALLGLIGKLKSVGIIPQIFQSW